MEKLGASTRFFIFSSGADEAILRGCEEGEWCKQANLGVLVCLTAFFSFVSVDFALSQTFIIQSRVDSLKIHGIAAAWASFIFSFDRMLVSNLLKVAPSLSDKIKGGLLILLRLVVATILSFTVSQPLEVKLFGDAISQDLLKAKDEYRLSRFKQTKDSISSVSNAYDSTALEKSRISGSSEYRNNSAAKARLTSDISQLTAITKRVQTLQTMISEANETDFDHLQRIEAELHALQIKHPNAEHLLHQKRLQLKAVVSDLERDNRRMRELEKRQNAMERQVTSLTDILKYEKQEFEKDGKQFEAGYRPTFMNQLRQLHRSAATDQTTLIAVIVLTALFMIIELSPILGKIFSPATEYDYKLREKIDASNATYKVMYTAYQELIQAAVPKIKEAAEIHVNSPSRSYFEFVCKILNRQDNSYSFNTVDNGSDLQPLTVAISDGRYRVLLDTAVTVVVTGTFFFSCKALGYFPAVTSLNIVSVLISIAALFFPINKFIRTGK